MSILIKYLTVFSIAVLASCVGLSQAPDSVADKVVYEGRDSGPDEANIPRYAVFDKWKNTGLYTEFFIDTNDLTFRSSVVFGLTILGGNESQLNMGINKSTFKDLYIGDCRNVSFFSHQSNYRQIIFDDDSIVQLQFEYDTVDHVLIRGCVFRNQVLEVWPSVLKLWTIKNTVLPDTVELRFSDQIFLDIDDLSHARKGKLILIVPADWDPRSVHMNYSNFEYKFDSTVTLQQKIRFHQKMLAFQRERGTQTEIEKADVLLKDLQIQNGDWGLKFQKYLWKYGYHKSKLILWAMAAFSLFYVINLLVFRKLILEVYAIKAIVERWSELKARKLPIFLQGRYYILVLMYSSLIFFGIKMDPESFSY